MKREDIKKVEDNLDYRTNKENRMEMASGRKGPGISARELADMPGVTTQEKIENALGIKVMPNIKLEDAIKLLIENKKKKG